jgi:hypothetical protein
MAWGSGALRLCDLCWSDDNDPSGRSALSVRAAKASEQRPAAGLWLSVDQLLTLPLEADGKAALWRLALEQQPDATAEQQLPLVVALARHSGQASAAAGAEGQWLLMQEQLEAAVASYQRLAKLAPDRADAARQELGNLIGKLMADLHVSVHAEQPPPPAERGALCWHGFRLGQTYRQLQLQLPEWLWHLEEQLVREGAIGLRELSQSTAEPGGSGLDAHQRQRWRRQALELLLHLGRLHQPCPDWILQAARELLAAESEALLSPDSEASAAELQQLLGWLARLPLPADQLAAVQKAAQRGIWGLQLIQQSGNATGKAPSQAARRAPIAVASTPEAAAPAVAAQLRDPRQLHQAIGLAVETWLADHPAGLRTQQLEPVLQPGAAPVLTAQGCLQLNLAPLLAFPQVELLDQLLPAFFSPLQNANRGSELELVEPHSALWNELGRFWQGGGQLNRDQWRGLVYATALWNRCGGSGALEARALGWTLPVMALQPGQSLLRPGNVELAALQTVLLQREELEDLLAEIRRRHHDRAWMEAQRDSWWFDPSDGSENLRRLHTNAGFYANSHAPLESLQRWSQASLRAMLGSSVLFGNASITEMFWPVAQQLVRQSQHLPQLVQWPGEQAFYNFIAGQEVLFVTPLAADVEAHHRTGLAFELFTDLVIHPYGLRCIEAPVSVYPNRPDRGFEDSLDRTLEQIDRAYKQKPFAVFTAACGAYGLPLCEAVKQRYGVSCIYVGNLMHAYFGVLQRTSLDWRASSRINEHWITSQALAGLPGIDRVESGRYLS